MFMHGSKGRRFGPGKFQTHKITKEKYQKQASDPLPRQTQFFLYPYPSSPTGNIFGSAQDVICLICNHYEIIHLHNVKVCNTLLWTL